MFKVKRTELIKHLENANKFCAKNKVLPALQMVWIIVEDWLLKVVATDMEKWYRGTLCEAIEWDNSFNISFIAWPMVKVLKLIEDEEVWLDKDGIHYWDWNELPFWEVAVFELELPKLCKTWTIDWECTNTSIFNAIDKVSTLIKEKNFTPVLTCVNLQYKYNKVQVFWTDSFIMRLCSVETEEEYKENWSINIPIQFLKALDLNVCKAIRWSENMVEIEWDDFVASSILISWTFPDYWRIIDACTESNDDIVISDIKEFKKNIDLISAYSEEIFFTRGNDWKVIMWTPDPKYKKLKVKTEFEYWSAFTDVAFKKEYLLKEIALGDTFRIVKSWTNATFDTGDQNITTICRPLILAQ